MTSLQVRALALLATLAAPACGSSTDTAPRGAWLEASWTGTDTGKLAAPAVAEWCDSLQMLEVRALHGDSGIALAMYPADTVVPDSYPVHPSATAPTQPPAAAVGLRWFGETMLRGFQGDSGAVILESIGKGALTGRFAAHLRSVTDGGRLRISGSFRGLTPAPARRGCVSRPTPADSGID